MKTRIQFGLIFFMLIGCGFFGFSQELNCLSFDGFNDYLDAPNTALNDIGTGDFTFEAWVNALEGNQPNHPTIFSNRPNQSSGTVFFFHYNSNISIGKLLTVQLRGVNYYVSNNGTLGKIMLDGDCHHVVITRANNLLSFYFDGGLIGTRNINLGNPSVTGTSNILIGVDDQYPGTHFNGNLSQIRIWNYARSQSEIQAAMNVSINGSSNGLLAYWEMNDGSGEVIVDKSGGGNAQRGSTTGTDINDPSWGSDCCIGNIQEPTNEGAYCCDGDNLVQNGNFELGDQNFMSSYLNGSTVNPGEYNVTNSATVFGSIVTDHSFCEDPIQFPNNDDFILINGHTQQTSNSIVWQQIVSGLEVDMQYKFCANFKNIPQCTFDILPQVDIQIGSTSTGFQTINANTADPCDWQNIEINFTATGTNQTINIVLDETGNGDGNDLAIDDISIMKLIDPALQITVMHQGNPQQVIASLNTISTNDDVLHGSDCQYEWFVAEVTSFPPLVINQATLVTGNAGGNGNGSAPWFLTTDFPQFNFNQNTLYIIGLDTPDCGCYAEASTYQLIYNNSLVAGEITEDELRDLIKLVRNTSETLVSNSEIESKPLSQLKIYPNPTQSILNIELLNGSVKSVKIMAVTGQTILSEQFSEANSYENINVSLLSEGMYILKVVDNDDLEYTIRFIKE